jgi:hypothetical protein
MEGTVSVRVQDAARELPPRASRVRPDAFGVR